MDHLNERSKKPELNPVGQGHKSSDGYGSQGFSIHLAFSKAVYIVRNQPPYFISLLFVVISCSSWNASHAQRMPSPESILPENTLLLLQIENTGDTIRSCKAGWYDVVYREKLNSGKLKPLQTPIAQKAFSQSDRDGDAHWLNSALSNIKCNESPVFNRLEMLSRSRELLSSGEGGNELIEAISSLFSGGSFFGLLDSDPYLVPVFGFEYDPSVFDWFEEVRRTSHFQSKKGECDLKSESVLGVEVVHLPFEGLFVFSIDDVLYGVGESEINKTRMHIDRILSSGAGGLQVNRTKQVRC
ncbi:MAG: hypothetical protein R3C03_08590 [Pirellulaceae bacterium]